MKSKILVTGATGMIGQALVERLHLDGQLFSAVGGKHSVEHKIHLAWELGTPLGEILEGTNTLVHLAARVHVRGAGFSDQDGFARDNAKFALELAKEAASRGVKRFVFVSSIGVLGATAQNPLTEEASPQPHNPYTCSKKQAEDLLRKFCLSSGLELVILRFPAVIGAGAKGNLGSLIHAVKRRFPLPISSIRNERQFITLQDLVAGILLASEHDSAAGETFHLANPERVSTLNLCQMIASALNVKLNTWAFPKPLLRTGFIFLGRRSLADGLTGDLLVDTSKISECLGWEPQQPVHLAVREAVESYC